MSDGVAVTAPAGVPFVEGTQPPADIPPEIFRAALATFMDLRRLDMRALALELGIGRATLYRKAGARDHLLGQVLWYSTRRMMSRALAESNGLRGASRVLDVVERFMHAVQAQTSLRRFLDREPEAALRILTSKQGPVQAGLVRTLTGLLEDEAAAGDLRLWMDPAALAFVIVRIGESFLYADVIADNDPDVTLAMEVIGKLLREG